MNPAEAATIAAFPALDHVVSSPSLPRALLAPRHWLTWLLIGLMWLLARLPWPVQRALGHGLGALAYRLARQRVNDTRTNLRLCFPELGEAEREALVREVFANGGLTLFETVNAWFRRPDYYRDKVTIRGLEHLRAAEAAGHGALLLGAHYSMIDLGGTLCAPFFQADMVYRPQKNPVIEYLMATRRSAHQGAMISYRDMRALMRSLKSGHTVWYPPDQDFGRKHAVFVPFFGVTAATITTVSRLAKVNESPVLFIRFAREGHQERYLIEISPSQHHFTGVDDDADAEYMNRELERMIRGAPAQYMWYHRRFKTRPDGAPFLYERKRKHR